MVEVFVLNRVDSTVDKSSSRNRGSVGRKHQKCASSPTWWWWWTKTSTKEERIRGIFGGSKRELNRKCRQSLLGQGKRDSRVDKVC